jgi:hypothetical protein
MTKKKWLKDHQDDAGERIKGDGIMVELVWLEEGYEGDYDETDPNDEPLLRFTVFEDDEDQNYGEQIQDGSYCTQLVAYADKKTLDKAIKLIHKTAVKTIKDGGFKRAMEELSWIDKDDKRLK